MIPAIDPQSGVLPPGIYEATWEELAARYGTTARRRILLVGLRQALDDLRRAGCRRMYVDGSFISNKRVPGDVDCCYEAVGMNWERLNPVLRDYGQGSDAQKQRYGCEFYPAEMGVGLRGDRMLDFFQRGKLTGRPKGIVTLDLAWLPEPLV